VSRVETTRSPEFTPPTAAPPLLRTGSERSPGQANAPLSEFGAAMNEIGTRTPWLVAVREGRSVQAASPPTRAGKIPWLSLLQRRLLPGTPAAALTALQQAM